MEEDFNNFNDMSIAQWVRMYEHISRREPEERTPLPEYQAIEWALTGRDCVERDCARLDALRNRPRVQSPNPYIRRDYDSVLGFTHDIPARGSMMIFIKPSPVRAITRKLKLRTSFMINGEVSNKGFEALYTSHCYTFIALHPCDHPG